MSSLPPPERVYSPGNEAETRRQIEATLKRCLKRGEDAYLTSDERLFQSAGTSITAHSGGGKASATKLTKAINNITTCAANGDSVLMPPAMAGMRVCVINFTAKSAQVFGQGSDTIDNVATATGVTQPSQTAVDYVCPADGAWFSL